MGDFFDDLRDLRRTTREARGAVREIGSAARQIDRTRGEVQGAINGHYGDEEFNRSGQRAYRQESRYYDARGRADDAREAYENRDEYRRDARSHEGLPPQGNGSRRPISQDEFRHTERAPSPAPAPQGSSMTAPKDDAVKPVTPPASTVAADAAKPEVANATGSTPAATANLVAASGNGAKLYSLGQRPAPRADETPKIDANQVAALQEMLIAAGHPLGRADGKYGPNTHDALKAFATKAGITDVTTLDFTSPQGAATQKFLAALQSSPAAQTTVAQTAEQPVNAPDAPMQEAVRQALAGGLQPTITGGADTGGPQGTPMTPNVQPDTGRSLS